MNRSRIQEQEARRVASLRMRLLEAHPFWGYLLLQVRLVPALALPTFAATDCVRRIWYNPFHTRHLSREQLGFVLAHEVGHQVQETLERRRGRDAHLWNCATDYAINRIVASIPQYAVPDGTFPGLGRVQCLLDRRYDNLVAESIYERLAEEQVPEPTGVVIVLPDRDGAPLRLPGVLDHHGGIDVHLPGTLSPREREELAERVRSAVETWRTHACRGELPAGLARGIDATRPGRVPWGRLFRSYVSVALSKDEYCRTRPNRRYLCEDIVVPGIQGERVGLVVVALDTSGSMGEEQLGAVSREIAALAEQAEDFRLVVADARVHEVVGLDELPRWIARRRTNGGGGTDHRPVFRWIEEHRVQPDVFVGLTDLLSAFPERPPSFPVVWVVPEEHGTAPWGTVVEVGGS